MAKKYLRFLCTVSGNFVKMKGPFMDLKVGHYTLRGDQHEAARFHDGLGWRDPSSEHHSCKSDECYNSEDGSCYCEIQILDEKDCEREDE